MVAFEKHLASDPDLARHKGGRWSAADFVCLLLAVLRRIGSGGRIVLIVKHLLSERHADPNSHYFVEMDLHKQIQTPLYGRPDRPFSSCIRSRSSSILSALIVAIPAAPYSGV